jgi:hypothetical protein
LLGFLGKENAAAGWARTHISKARCGALGLLAVQIWASRLMVIADPLTFENLTA